MCKFYKFYNICAVVGVIIEYFTLPSKITNVGVTDCRHAEKGLEHVKRKFIFWASCITFWVESFNKFLKIQNTDNANANTHTHTHTHTHTMALVSEFSISPIILFPVVLPCISPKCWICALILSPCSTSFIHSWFRCISYVAATGDNSLRLRSSLDVSIFRSVLQLRTLAIKVIYR